MELPPPIGKYELEEFLGGGMSHVYRARDTLIGRTVAVKILTEAGCQDPETKERFLAEARMAGNLSHDNIIAIYDFGVDERSRPFLVMEFLRGEDLRHAIRNGRTGDLAARLRIALQLARALEYIHLQKIVHRDIKPDNVHVTPAGVVKLMDFGIAKTEGLAMTRAGYVLGTPYYMAPEQVTAQHITPQVDVYAFGVLLFELITGAKPISGDTIERIFYSILNEPLNLEPMLQAAAPQSLCDLVARCTAKDPAERPQGFAPVCAELERALAAAEIRAAPTVAAVAPPSASPPAPTLPAAPAPPSSAGKPPRRWIAPVAVAALILAAVAAYLETRPKVAPLAPAASLAKTLATSTGEMLLVPAGDFEFGENKLHVSLPAYYIDKTEVSNAAYAEFCAATGRPLPAGFDRGQPGNPVVNITVFDAHQFATWAGKRLPSAKEWEKAARGTGGLAFPWGNEMNAARANVGTGRMDPALSHQDGASPWGAVNMVGNVWEFVEQLSVPSARAADYFRSRLTPAPGLDESWYQIRGESFDDKLEPGAVWDVATVPARWKAPNLGFRCVRDAAHSGG